MNTAPILGHVFNSSSRQHPEVCASQFPVLQNVMDMVPPSEAYLYGCIIWSLAQALQQSTCGLSQSSMRGGKARPMTGFHFSVPKASGVSGKEASLRV